MRDDLIAEVLKGPMREAEVRDLPDDRLEAALRERGFELDPIELKTVRQIRDQAVGLQGEDLEAFLDANARSSIEVQGSDLSSDEPGSVPSPDEEADTISGRPSPAEREDEDR